MIFIKVCYIKKIPKESFYYNIFNVVRMYYDNNNIIINIPKPREENIYRIKKISQKVIKKLQKHKINYVILEEELNGIRELKEYIYSKKINIIDGKKTYNYLLFQIISIIFCKINKKMEKSEVSIMIKDCSDLNVNNIKKIARNVKIVKIITSQIEKFSKISQELYNELGVIVIVGNNKKLPQKSDIIVNIDFTEEEINKYIIPLNSVIINCENKVNIKAKKFNGIIINDLDVCIPEVYKCKGIKDLKAYEAILYKYNFKNLNEKIKADNITIKNLFGTKNIIEENDWQNILDKNRIVV